MSEEIRSNQGYEIIESCTIGSTELVIGHNPKAPNPYVGCYCNELSEARESLSERYNKERSMPYNNPPAPKQKSGDDRER